MSLDLLLFLGLGGRVASNVCKGAYTCTHGRCGVETTTFKIYHFLVPIGLDVAEERGLLDQRILLIKLTQTLELFLRQLDAGRFEVFTDVLRVE